MIKAGLVVNRHQAFTYLKNIKKNPGFMLTALYEPEFQSGKKLFINNPGKLTNVDSFIENTDAVIIASTCFQNSYALIEKALKRLKHVYIADPLCLSVHEAHKLIKLNAEIPSILHIGNLSDVHPFMAQFKISNIRWINIRKNMSGKDDLDYEIKRCISQANYFTNSDLKKVDAFQLPTNKSLYDAGEVRIEFFDGLVMNIQLLPDIWEKKYTIEVCWNENYLKFDFNKRKIYTSLFNKSKIIPFAKIPSDEGVMKGLTYFKSAISSPSPYKNNDIEPLLKPLLVYQYIHEKIKRTSIIC